jgi:phage FluMu protein Com
MFEDNNNNTIIIDVNARRRNKKQKILCVLCSNVQLEPTSIEGLQYKCPRCKNTYQLGYEILEHEDDFESSHEDEDIELAGLDSNNTNSVGLLVANDPEDDDDDEDQKEGSIPIPKYMKDSSDGKKVIEYHEE